MFIYNLFVENYIIISMERFCYLTNKSYLCIINNNPIIIIMHYSICILRTENIPDIIEKLTELYKKKINHIK